MSLKVIQMKKLYYAWHEPSRARTCDQRIKSPLLYQLSYRFILALLSPLPSSENSCSDLGLLFNGLPGCIRTLLICELTSLTFYLGLQIPQQVVSALLLLRRFFIVTPQMTMLPTKSCRWLKVGSPYSR